MGVDEIKTICTKIDKEIMSFDGVIENDGERVFVASFIADKMYKYIKRKYKVSPKNINKTYKMYALINK